MQLLIEKYGYTCNVCFTTPSMYLHDDIVDGYVDKFHEESNETHYAKSDGRGDRDLLELCKLSSN